MGLGASEGGPQGGRTTLRTSSSCEATASTCRKFPGLQLAVLTVVCPCNAEFNKTVVCCRLRLQSYARIQLSREHLR